jgi:hypothetical protein
MLDIGFTLFLQSRGVLTVLLYIFIKQRNVQTFWGIIHVCQAIVETGSVRKLSHNGCTAGNFDLPLPVPMAARITKYLNKYVRRGICLIYMSSFYIWSPPLARQMRKTNMRYYPEYKQRHVQTFWGILHVCQAILETGSVRKLSHNGCTVANFDLPDHGFLLLTCSTGPMEWSTGYSYYLNKYVHRGICLIYMSSFYIWSPPLARQMRKTNKRYYPEYPSGSWHPILAP